MSMFVNKKQQNHNIILIGMAEKQIVSKGFRVSKKADEILKDVCKRDFRDFPTVVRYALLIYVKELHSDLYEILAEDFTPQ